MPPGGWSSPAVQARASTAVPAAVGREDAPDNGRRLAASESLQRKHYFSIRALIVSLCRFAEGGARIPSLTPEAHSDSHARVLSYVKQRRRGINVRLRDSRDSVEGEIDIGDVRHVFN